MSGNHPARALAHFFKQGSGCVFASSFAGDGLSGRISFASFPEFDALSAADVEQHLDGCGGAGRAACCVFPDVQSDAGVVSLLTELADSERWRCSRSLHAASCVRVEWRTQDGAWSQAMGLAPMFAMPASRRAPYLALALWTGAADAHNESGEVGFVDMPSKLEQSAHRRGLWNSMRSVDEILGADAGPHWRTIAFRFSESSTHLLPAHW